ncbi:MAG: DUF599 domain-containing protein [Methylococcales bacterium]|nr:DUF599 domain-containing protein [Methylococcales bacterium]
MTLNYDLIAFIVSNVLTLAYYLYLNRLVRRKPERSVHTFNAKIRAEWVNKVMGNDNMNILAVQTLRNSVMAANFMASTSILLIMGALNLSDKAQQWASLWPLSTTLQVSSADIWQIKLGLLLLDFAVAFYYFSMAIRLFNHVGYMINLPRETMLSHDLFKQTCAYLNKAGRYYSLGTRTFFFSLPIILWFFGPHFLILGTVILMGGLIVLDKVPS